MEFNSNTIRAEIETWRTTSGEKAEALYQKCVRNEITYTEGWHLLPGPAPNVYYPHSSTNAHIAAVDYQHLTGQQAKTMFERKEEERKQQEFQMQKQLEVIQKTETEKPTELQREIDAARRAYDVAETSVRNHQARVEALEEQLRVYKNALETQRSVLATAKEAKERMESTRENILTNLKQTRKEAEEDCNRMRTTLHTLAQTAQQRQEKDKLYIQMLYNRLAQTETKNDSKGYHTKPAMEKRVEVQPLSTITAPPTVSTEAEFWNRMRTPLNPGSAQPMLTQTRSHEQVVQWAQGNRIIMRPVDREVMPGERMTNVRILGKH